MPIGRVLLVPGFSRRTAGSIPLRRLPIFRNRTSLPRQERIQKSSPLESIVAAKRGETLPWKVLPHEIQDRRRHVSASSQRSSISACASMDSSRKHRRTHALRMARAQRRTDVARRHGERTPHPQNARPGEPRTPPGHAPETNNRCAHAPRSRRRRCKRSLSERTRAPRHGQQPADRPRTRPRRLTTGEKTK